MSFIDRLLSIGEGKTLKKLEKIADQVSLIEDDFVNMDDEELKGQTASFRQRLENGATLDDILPEAFATVREASKRVLGKRPFDVQIMGGAALHQCNIAEMKTGEGKTIVALMPSYLNALEGKGVHVVTVNDYLAEFQSEQMGRVHHFLGLDVGVILSQMTPAERRKAYNADITYGTNNEFGFDYLRDNMAMSVADQVQRGHNFAIVDEVDSILVDEARTPLIISGPATENKQWYPVFSRLAQRLVRDEDYEVDEKKRTVAILASGIEKTEDTLGISNLYESANTPLIGYLNNAIRAKELFHRDKDYVVANGEVLIVDEHTGRTLVGRRYNEGLHQALESKEGVEVKDEYQTLATITLQNYFRMYRKLAGMTGTAKTEESEFQKIYGLGVIVIPTNVPMIREDKNDQIYRTEDAKFDAIVRDVAERHENGQPVLLGTASVEKSEELSRRLKKAGIPHQVLNAKQHEREATVVAEAGRKGAVTVATNMAGRGTDIMLGGNPEFMATQDLKEREIDPVEDAEEYEKEMARLLPIFEKQVQDEHDEVTDLGGLYVVGSERHESRRIDNQLRGRSGRQGDPGESRFYLSLEDDLLRLFRPEVVQSALVRLNVPDDEPIEMKMISKSIESAQKQMEAQNFEIRKNVLKYDDVMNRQRHAIYGDREKVLKGENIKDIMLSYVERVVGDGVRNYLTGFSETWNLDGLWQVMSQVYPVSLKQSDFEDVEEVEDFADAFVKDAVEAYDRLETALGQTTVSDEDDEEISVPTMRELERQVWLSVLDHKWREHLYEMDYLREGIGLRAMAQRDPLVEYQREGAQMFDQMQAGFVEEVVRLLFNNNYTLNHLNAEEEMATQLEDLGEVEPDNLDETPGQPGEDNSSAENKKPDRKANNKRPNLTEPRKSEQYSYSAPSEDGSAETSARQVTKDEWAKVKRNEPCPCGSGKKYKYCHYQQNK